MSDVLIWYLVGPKAGTRELVSEDEAAKLVAADDAEIVNGNPLRYPENHPYVRDGRAPHPHANRRRMENAPETPPEPEPAAPKKRRPKRSAA